jgi:hypothetical protein
MKHRLFGLTMGAMFLGSLSMANAGQPVALTNGQMDNVTAGASATANAINVATSEAISGTGNSYGHSTNVAVAADVTLQNAIAAAIACDCSSNHLH